MLNANTIEFNGRKAVINSYTTHPALEPRMNEQREEFKARFPNATVKTEMLPDWQIIDMVARSRADKSYSVWTIGEDSNKG